MQVRFKIEGSDDLREWKTVASPSFTNYGNNHIFDFDLYKFDVPRARGVKVKRFDNSCPPAPRGKLPAGLSSHFSRGIRVQSSG
jgi:hypothetical protein